MLKIARTRAEIKQVQSFKGINTNGELSGSVSKTIRKEGNLYRSAQNRVDLF